MTERQKTMIWKQTQAKRDRFLKRMIREWHAALMSQIEPVLNEIDESTVKDIASRVPVLMTEEVIATQLFATVGLVGPYFATNTFNDVSKAVPDDRVIKQDVPTDEEWLARITAILGVQAGERITQITNASREQTIKIVQDVLQKGTEEGLGISQLATLLRDELFKQWDEKSTYRAARIARTEIVNASNLGSLAGAQETNEPLLKVWLSTRDSRTRRDTRGGQYPPGPFDHYGKFPTGPDGEMQELTDKFQKTGEELNHPGDYAGSAGNVINCRCTMFYEPKEVELIN